MKFMVYLMIMGLAFVTYAAPEAVVKKWVTRYYETQASLPRPLPDPNEPPQTPPGGGAPAKPPRCTPNAPIQDCVEAVCQQVSRFECDESWELSEITRACRNVDGNCVRRICSRVSRFDCDDRWELMEVADACRGVLDVSCIDYVCSRLSRFDCDEVHELKEIARQCR